jgi:hypothetical protein
VLSAPGIMSLVAGWCADATDVEALQLAVGRNPDGTWARPLEDPCVVGGLNARPEAETDLVAVAGEHLAWDDAETATAVASCVRHGGGPEVMVRLACWAVSRGHLQSVMAALPACGEEGGKEVLRCAVRTATGSAVATAMLRSHDSLVDASHVVAALRQRGCDPAVLRAVTATRVASDMFRRDAASMLSAAATWDHTAAIRLVKGCAPHDVDLQPALLAALTAGHSASAVLLVEMGAACTAEAMMMAARLEDDACARCVAARVPLTSQDVVDALAVACRWGRLSVARFVALELGVPEGALEGPMYHAVTAGSAELVRLLLDAGADVHANGEDALSAAVHAGDPEVVLLLLRRGADARFDSSVALRRACEGCDTHVIAALLDHGADPNANDGEPLLAAVNARNVAAAQLLLLHGAVAHARSDQAVRRAAAIDDPDMLELLVAHGADIHAADDEPIRVAGALGHFAVLHSIAELRGSGQDIESGRRALRL